MIESIFALGILAQISLFLGKAYPHYNRSIQHYNLLLLVLVGVVEYLSPQVFSKSNTFSESFLTMSAVCGILFSIGWGLGTFCMAQKITKAHVLMLHMVAVYIWFQHPPFHAAFVWHWALLGSTPLLCLSLFFSLERHPTLRHLLYLWQLFLLTFFGILLFLPFQETIVPRPIEALFLGALLIIIASSIFFSAKYFALFSTSSFSQNKKVQAAYTHLADLLFTTPQTKTSLLLFGSGLCIIGGMHFAILSESFLLQILLLFYYNTSTPLSKAERKTIG